MEIKDVLFVLKDSSLENKTRNILSDLDINATYKIKEKITKEDFSKKDLIVSIGGDGTFLSAAHFVLNHPIIGVNSDERNSEGALTSITLEKLKEKLLEIFNKKFIIKSYTRENVRIIKKDQCIQTELALNEAYLGNINPHHPSNYILTIKDKIEKQRSSGIVISTGTGLTAWYNAMGGKPFNREDKLIKFKVREPYHGRIHNVELVEGQIAENEVIILESLMNHGLVAVDSIRTYELQEGDKIEISIGNQLNVIQ